MSEQHVASAVKAGLGSVTQQANDLKVVGSKVDGSVSGSLLDQETGQRVSKNELKKRQKQRERERLKAEGEVNRQTPSDIKERAEGQEEKGELSANQYFEIRSQRVKRMKETQSPNPYPHKFHVTYDLRNFQNDFGHLKKGETVEGRSISVGCRIYNIRTSGKNLRFYEVAVDGAEVQIMATSAGHTGSIPFAEQHDILRRGDIVGVTGFPCRTSPKRTDAPGDLSISAHSVTLLAPCLHQIPSEHYGFRDREERYRNRHLDLIMNKSTVNTFLTRAKIVRYIRDYFNNAGFYEIETPILLKNPGGATAKPFYTYHNDLGMNLALRIATELPLKQLVVGGIHKVYELGRQFRNEGIDLTHNPEFTLCEYYEAFADVYDVMDRTETLVEGMVQAICGTLQTTFTTQHGETYNVDWSRPWKRVEMIPALEEACGEKFPPGEEMHTEATHEFLQRMLAKINVECPPPLTNARMLDRLVGECIEERCINPTFIMQHPQMMSPLAKSHRSKPGLCERFEAFVCKREIVNAYTELNDPFDQRLRFEEQARQKAQGDDEVQVPDEGFLTAMEYGLPPTGGWGMGIDRMVMFLTNHYSIKEVLAFPFMKDEVVQAKPKTSTIVDVGSMHIEDTKPK
ncbi:hypothetical protein GRF29_213g713623 [Pseudopithomyces chartarum]|uniref:Probable lysine--tRNA ligase, cytoplasmic n=1 Tax=Pseudopithomyces chartarum TaxID=1892770 RepID=A0AAN6LMZ0_9PLEO|nr:hypothetical protein GRF29_213g713623 [Pseudopithomyces chartarum]